MRGGAVSNPLSVEHRSAVCSEHQFTSPESIAAHMDQSAAAVADYGFDGVKLDVRPRLRARKHARTHADNSVAVLRCAWGGS